MAGGHCGSPQPALGALCSVLCYRTVPPADIRVTSLHPKASPSTFKPSSSSTSKSHLVSRLWIADCGLFCSSRGAVRQCQVYTKHCSITHNLECLTQCAPVSPPLRHAEWGTPNLDPMEGQRTPPAPGLAQHFLTAESGADNDRRERFCRLTPTQGPGGRAKGFSHWPAGKSLKSLAPDSRAQLREFGAAIRLIV